MSKLVNIIKSRFIDGESLPQWYEDRLQICSICSYNSNNTGDKSKAWELIAGAHCTECGCTISQKSKIEEESCPRGKWTQVKTEKSDLLNITTDTDVAKFKYDTKLGFYVVDYGEIIYNFNSSIRLYIENKGISNLNVRSSCGCTTATPKKTDNGIELSVKYDTKRIGGFRKNVTLNYTKGDLQKRTLIQIKGTVKQK